MSSQLSPLLKDTVLKRTFNATLQNPAATQMDNTICKNGSPAKFSVSL